MCGPEDPLFTSLVPLARVPFRAKESVHKTLFWENFINFSLYSLNFHPNFSSQAPKFGNFQLTSPQIWKFSAHRPPNLKIFSSQAPKFGNFQLTSPQIWKFSAHKPPFSEANVSSQAPHFENPGRTPLPEKKLGKSILQVPDTCTQVLDNTRPFLHSSIVSFWITPAHHIFMQYWYTRNVPVFTNTGTFQYLGPEVYFFQKLSAPPPPGVRHTEYRCITSSDQPWAPLHHSMDETTPFTFATFKCI